MRVIGNALEYGRPLDCYISLPSGRLSNFKYSEFVESNTAVRQEIENRPNEGQWKKIEVLVVKVLQPLRDRFGRIRINSGFRTPALCLATGSGSNSNHTKGEAADIIPLDSRITRMEMLQWAHDNLEYRELIAEYFPSGWIHIAYREGGNTRKLMIKDAKHSYNRVTIDYLRKLFL